MHMRTAVHKASKIRLQFFASVYIDIC